MKNLLTEIAIFAGGVAVGIAFSHGYFKKKSEDEIAAMREMYREKQGKSLQDAGTQDGSDDRNPVEDIAVTATVAEHHRNPDLDELAVKYGYKLEGELEADEDAPVQEPLRRQKKLKEDEPYVISPDEFGEVGYEQIELTYYDDGVLADDNDEIIDDIEDVVGPYALTSFGKYEDDAVFVRNDARKCDYEILADHRNYDDVARARQVEV